MPVSPCGFLQVGLEQVGVDHFMDQSLFELIAGAELEERLGERYGGRSKAFVLAGTSAEGHLGGPADDAILEESVEEGEVVVLEEFVGVVVRGVGVGLVKIGVGDHLNINNRLK